MTDFDRREYDWRRWLGGGGSGKKLLSPYVSAALMLSKSMVNMQFDSTSLYFGRIFIALM